MKLILHILFVVIYCSAALAQDGNSKLPFLKNKFASDSVKLPEPVGIGVSGLVMSQQYIMTDLRLDGEPVDFFNVSQANGMDVIAMPRVDVWVLPFFNAYAFAGVIKGTLDLKVNGYDKDIPEFNFELPLQFDYTGAYYGLGASVVLANKNVFAMLDANYSQAKLTNLDAELTMYMTSGRFGYQTLKNNNLMLWIGTMHQDVNQTMKQMSGGLEVQTTVKVKEPLNFLIGSRYTVENWGFVAEFGGVGRSQALLSVERRF